MRVLDIGVGQNKEPSAIGIDINPYSLADIICDLNKFPWPLADNKFDLVICRDILEHLDDIIKAMEEIYRICKNGALVKIQVPFASSSILYADPTHKRGFTSKSFNYFIRGTAESKYFYSSARFKLYKCKYITKGSNRAIAWLDRLIVALANLFKNVYESRFMHIYPIPIIYFELIVDKDEA